MSSTQTDSTLYAQVVALLIKLAPKYADFNGTIQTDPAYYSLGILYAEISRAAKAGKTVQEIASAIANMVRQEGWVRATGEFSDADLQTALGLDPKKKGPKSPMTPAAAKALASNGANINEANNGGAFSAVDGHVVRIEDADHDAQVKLLNDTYPATPDAPAKPPVDPGPGPFGSPGIG